MMTVRCAKIGVNCTKNDPVDVRAGGPKWLGFDFFVKVKDAEEIMKYISSVLATFEVPETDIYISDFYSLPDTVIWTKERILKEIEKNAPMIKEEATRSYSTYKPHK